MAKTFFELLALCIGPLILAVSAWIIAIKAMTWTDEISEVVRALTRPDGDEEKTKVGADFLSCQHEKSDCLRNKKQLLGTKIISYRRTGL